MYFKALEYKDIIEINWKSNNISIIYIKITAVEDH